MSLETFMCFSCKHVTTSKGKQCYTLTRTIKEQIIDKNLPFYPSIVNPIIDEMSQKCKRYINKVVMK